jgi:two-component system, NarL family, nitrate/nitrite response regulator NarL
MCIGEPSERGKEEHGLLVISVLVVGRVVIHREGIVRLLAESPRTRVVGTATRSEDALSRIRELGPDVALVDLPTEELCWLALILDEVAPERTLVAIVTGEAEGEIVMRAGGAIRGFVTHQTSIEQLMGTIERAVGEDRPAAASTPPAAIAALTEREREILGMVGEGLANKEIARRLQIELATVKSHIHNILKKLGVNSRTEAAAVVLWPRGEM